MNVPSGYKLTEDGEKRFFIDRECDNVHVCVVEKCAGFAQCAFIKGIPDEVKDFAAYTANKTFGIMRVVYLCVGKI